LQCRAVPTTVLQVTTVFLLYCQFLIILVILIVSVYSFTCRFVLVLIMDSARTAEKFQRVKNNRWQCRELQWLVVQATKWFISVRNINNPKRRQNLKLGTTVCKQTPTTRSSAHY